MIKKYKNNEKHHLMVNVYNLSLVFLSFITMMLVFTINGLPFELNNKDNSFFPWDNVGKIPSSDQQLESTFYKIKDPEEMVDYDKKSQMANPHESIDNSYNGNTFYYLIANNNDILRFKRHTRAMSEAEIEKLLRSVRHNGRTIMISSNELLDLLESVLTSLESFSEFYNVQKALDEGENIDSREILGKSNEEGRRRTRRNPYITRPYGNRRGIKESIAIFNGSSEYNTEVKEGSLEESVAVFSNYTKVLGKLKKGPTNGITYVKSKEVKKESKEEPTETTTTANKFIEWKKESKEEPIETTTSLLYKSKGELGGSKEDSTDEISTKHKPIEGRKGIKQVIKQIKEVLKGSKEVSTEVNKPGKSTEEDKLVPLNETEIREYSNLIKSTRRLKIKIQYLIEVAKECKRFALTPVGRKQFLQKIKKRRIRKALKMLGYKNYKEAYISYVDFMLKSIEYMDKYIYILENDLKIGINEKAEEVYLKSVREVFNLFLRYLKYAKEAADTLELLPSEMGHI